ncbi:MAG TPA: cupin domain-containing protein [Candidatus Binatia bacterium]|nr:cupin domain-containing protein [Candidatus Binatia bacterium]
MKNAVVDDSVEILNRDMAEKNLGGHWQLGFENYAPYPETTVQPWLWKWTDVYESLMRAGDVVSMEEAERRTVRLLNPALRDRQATTHTIHFSFQYVKPGEHARPHRHTAAALRFILKGSGAYTTVNGQKCVMEEGDLILTPQLTWHDHTNDSGKPIIWLDGLDIPLVQSLQQLLFEPYMGDAQPIATTSEEVALSYGHPRPGSRPASAFFHYKWSDAYRGVRALVDTASLDRFDGYLLEYRDMTTGGPTMPTIQCALSLLRPDQETEAHRHTSTVIYHVFRGRGSSFVGEERFDWEAGDSFVVPLWHPHRHLNGSPSEEAILFSMSDVPVLKSLSLYREEPVGQ